MLEQDYLMRILLQFAEILRRSWIRARDDRDPKAAADMLEDAVGEATDIDGGTLLSLAPESMASILQVSGTDPRVIEYVARSLMLVSLYLREAGEDSLADLRLAQARSLGDAYGLDLPDDPADMPGLLDEFEGAEEAIIDIASADGPAGPGSVAADDDPGFGRDADARR
ncbi:hypothetical protein [Gordonibacter massiliensis (ex Traore et al. 2017)]|uniref:Uncharacterized protein n=1 Tax=Gordonibacter massiliensis (ex Traore et al. 2017) TaxID=1841863 RepID=A0A842JEY0_9ACTN|nr:hypothetical protein [Gordonibacter massiliensis (ex Traore et al. 2017)]MBC2889051.1 hypothetical protein [Gordonibacter massiliensis (ex Traore et al. 2017)]